MAKTNKPADRPTMTAAEALDGLQSMLTPAEGQRWLEDIRQGLDVILRRVNSPNDDHE